MRIAVAGSSGLIGTSLVAALRADGHTALRLVRRAAHGPDEIEWHPEHGRVDLSRLEGCDGLVNLCGAGIASHRWSGAYKQELRDSRIASTELAVEAVTDARIPVLVNAGAVGYYGDSGDRIVDETAPAGTGFLADLCRDWEAVAARAESSGARVVRIRSGIVLSRFGGTLRMMLPLYRFGLGGRLSDGRQYVPWITLEDEVRAIVHLLTDESAAGPVNLTGPAPVTNAAFSSALAGCLHRPAPWVVPAPALSAALGEFARECVLSGQRAIPAALESSGFTFVHNTVGEALSGVLGE